MMMISVESCLSISPTPLMLFRMDANVLYLKLLAIKDRAVRTPLVTPVYFSHKYSNLSFVVEVEPTQHDSPLVKFRAEKKINH